MSFHFKKFLFYMLLLCGNIGLFAKEQEESVILFKKEADLLLVGKQTYFLEDIGGKLSIDDVLKPENMLRFKLGDKDIFTRRASNTTYWFKLILKNESGKDAWIELGSTLLWYVDYYTYVDGKSKLVTTTGSLRHEKNKAYPSNLYLLPLGSDRDQQTVLIRIETFRPIELPIQVGSVLSLHENKSSQDYLIGVCFGFMIFMLIYHFGIIIATRDKTLFYYVGTLLFGIPSALYLSNYTVGITEITENWAPFLISSPFLLLLLPFIFLTLFAVHFLELEQNNLFKYSIRILILFPLLALMIFDALNVFPHYTLVWIFQPFILFTQVYLFGIGVFVWLRMNNGNGLIFASGSIIIILGSALYLLTINGYIAYNFFNRNAILFSIGLQSIIFSFGIIARFNRLQSDKASAESALLAMANDQRENLERAVKQSHDFSESIMDSLTETIAVIDMLGNIIRVNHNWKKFAQENGGSPSIFENYTNQNYFQVFESGANSGLEEAKDALLGIQAVLNGELANFSLEYPCHSPNQNRWFLMYVVPLKGQVKGAVISHINITDRKNKEEQMHRLQVKFESSIDSIADGILITSINGTIIKSNNSFKEMFQATEDLILHSDENKLYQFISHQKKNPSEFLRKTNEILQNGEDNSFDYLELMDGSHYERYSQPLVIDGIIFGRVWHFHDITELMEAQLVFEKAKDIAEAANQAKSNFLATMSHEIRTPLNAIIGFTDLLQKSELNDTQFQQLKIVTNASNVLLSIVNNILDFSKIEAGKLELHLEMVEIRKLMEEILDVNRFQANSKQIDLILNISEQIPSFLILDYTRIQQVIINLISNALKFTKEGEIELKLDWIESTASEDHNQLSFSIRDTGIGIALENREKIFEAFSQEDSSTTRNFGGTGLGLSICNKLLQLMDSKLELESEVGKGSRFFFTLNISNQENTLLDFLNDLKKREMEMGNAENSRIAENTPNPNGSLFPQNINVLIVDDDDINLFLAMSILVEILPEGILREAHNGEEAVEMFQKEKPDIVFMDVQMPLMNGYTATGEIRKLETGSRTPIIALTAGIINEEVAKCYDAGMDDFASKPIVKATFEKLIHKWIKNGQ